jgi:SOS response regulatory protein OraA/RecX
MLESGHLTEGGENYIRRRLQERGVSPQDIEAIASAPREYSFWQILKDTLRGCPKPLE